MKLSDARCPLMLVSGILWGWNAGVLFYLSPRLSDVSTLECCGMWYNGQCLGPDGSAIGYWVNTTHTSTTQMKTSRQKRPRMCQLGFLWLFPTKIWFYVNCGPVRGRGLYNLWYAAGWWSVGRQGGMLSWNPGPRPGVSVLYRPGQPPAGSEPASSHSAGAWSVSRHCRPAYSPSEGLGCLFLSNKIMSRECWDNERGQVSNSYWECGNQERPGLASSSLHLFPRTLR